MRALLLGYYGARNLGDDMMLACLLQWLEKQHVQVTVVSENPSETEQRFHVEAVENAPLLGEWAWRKSWFQGYAARLLRAIKSHDALIVGGGDLIRDDRGWRTFWYTMEKIVFAHLFSRPVFLVNIGIGRPVTKTGHFVLKWSLSRCRKIIVRDDRSFQVCKDLGCAGFTELAPDIAIRLPKIFTLEKADDKEDVFSKNGGYVVVCLRGTPNDFGQYPIGDDQVKNFAKALDNIVEEHGANIMFLPFQYGSDVETRSFQSQIIHYMLNHKHLIKKEWSGDFQDIIACLRDSKLIVGMRLHAVVLAVALNRRCVVMPYDVKLYEFAKQFGLTHLLPASDLHDVDIVGERLKEALHDIPAYDLRLADLWEHLTLE
jgi:polysaccharide pyruvyl transferase CsaB